MTKDLYDMFQLSWGFVPYMILVNCLQNNFFEEINTKNSIQAILKQTNYKKRPLFSVLNILEKSKLININKNKIHLTEITQIYFLKKSQSYVGDYFIRNLYLLEAYKNTFDLLKTDRPNLILNQKVKQSFGLNKNLNFKKIAAFQKPMKAVSEIIYKDLFKYYKINKESSILDIGGGFGALSSSLKEKAVTVDILETEKVAISGKILNKKLKYINQNWFDFKSKKKYDYVFLSHVLHEEKKANQQKLFNIAVESLKQKGEIVVIGFTDNYNDLKNYLFDIFKLNLLLEMGGDVPTDEEILKLFRKNKTKLIKTKILPGGRKAFIGVKI
jgi:2-polyprenyl-3-methyl-5-hydroxy-6-metoxy-1,4-benzoquinol methylase